MSIAEGEMRVRRRVCIAFLWDGWHLIWMAGAVVFLKSPMSYILVYMQRKGVSILVSALKMWLSRFARVRHWTNVDGNRSHPHRIGSFPLNGSNMVLKCGWTNEIC